MVTNGHQTAAHIGANLKHRVVDADGHWTEFGPYVREQLRRIGGDRAVEGFSLMSSLMDRNLLTFRERQDRRVAQGPWWGLPTKNTKDRATSMMPRLLYERMDEFGFDFSVLYPTAGMSLYKIP